MTSLHHPKQVIHLRSAREAVEVAEAEAAVLVAAVLEAVALALALRALRALQAALVPQAALEVEALEVHHHRPTLVVAHQVALA